MPTSRMVPILLLLAACATNPVTGRRELSLVSESQEIEMGRQSLAASQAQTGFYDDPELTAYVREMGMKMARAPQPTTRVSTGGAALMTAARFSGAMSPADATVQGTVL